MTRGLIVNSTIKPTMISGMATVSTLLILTRCELRSLSTYTNGKTFPIWDTYAKGISHPQEVTVSVNSSISLHWIAPLCSMC